MPSHAEARAPPPPGRLEGVSLFPGRSAFSKYRPHGSGTHKPGTAERPTVAVPGANTGGPNGKHRPRGTARCTSLRLKSAARRPAGAATRPGEGTGGNKEAGAAAARKKGQRGGLGRPYLGRTRVGPTAERRKTI